MIGNKSVTIKEVGGLGFVVPIADKTILFDMLTLKFCIHGSVPQTICHFMDSVINNWNMVCTYSSLCKEHKLAIFRSNPKLIDKDCRLKERGW